MCNPGKGFVGGLLPNALCADCSSPCERCSAAGNSAACLTCNYLNGGQSPSYSGFTCTCAAGYKEISPAVCKSCYEVDCQTSDEQLFIAFTSGYSLPITTEVASLICYRQRTFGSDCQLPSLNYFAGSAISTSGTNLTPTTAQCQSILHSQWPLTVYWFSQFFPSVIQVVDNTDLSFYVPLLWILEFGPSRLSSDPVWQVFLRDINALGLDDWENFLAWSGDTPQYTLDGGSTFKDLPEGLEAKLVTGTIDWTYLNGRTTLCCDPADPLWEKCLLSG